MSAAGKTDYVQLPQFGDNDKPTWGGDFNEAMLAIDAEFSTRKNDLAAVNQIASAATLLAQEAKAASEGVVAAVDAKIVDKVGKGSIILNVLDYGVKGDGVTDDTDAINAVLARGGRTVLFPAGKYMIDADKDKALHVGLKMKAANMRLTFEQGAEICVIPNASQNYVALSVTAPDCVVEGGLFTGDVGYHLGSVGEWGHLIVIDAGGDRFKGLFIRTQKAWGDGFTIQRGPVDVSLTECIADDNRRQGLSYTGGSRGRINGGSYINTGKTSFTLPCAGIDVEPNPNSGFSVNDLIITGVTLSGNRGEGLLAIRAAGVKTEFTAMGCTAFDNGKNATASGFRMGGSAGTMRAVLTSCRSESNSAHGFDLYAEGVNATDIVASNNVAGGIEINGLNQSVVGPIAKGNGTFGIRFNTGASGSIVTGGVTDGNSQAGNGASSNVECEAVGNVRINAHTSKAGAATNKPAYGYHWKAGAGITGYADGVQGSFGTGNYLDVPGTNTMIPRPGYGTLAAPAIPTADATSLKTFSDAIRVILIDAGLAR